MADPNSNKPDQPAAAGRKPEDAAERLPAPERTDLEAASRDEARAVHRLIEELPDEQGRVIELAYFGGFTHREIADMLEAPIGTIKGRMRLGLEKMRVGLEGLGLGEAVR